MSDLLRIGASGLNAAYAQLQNAGQNIANAATPGYVRREVQLSENRNVGAGMVSGSGVDVTGVRRVYDQFLSREAVSTQSSAAQDTARSDALQRLDAVFADPGTGLGAAFDDMMQSFADLSSRPADASVRTAVLARVDGFAERASSLDARLTDLRASTQGRMAGDVEQANDLLASIARINRQIGQTAGSASAPNALLDQRDTLLADLNRVVRANASFGADGTVSVTTQSGEPLVTGEQASRLSLVPDTLDASAFDLSIARGNGTAVRVELSAVGGSLAGMARFADDDIAASRARLGQIVAGVAQAFNNQQAAGLDSTGAPGSPFFTVGTPTASAASGNGGTAQLSVSIANGSAMKASDYALAWDGSNYQLTRLADGQVNSFAALPQSIDGLTISLGSGTPAQGDRFLLRTASTVIPGLAAAMTDPQKIATASASTTVDWASDNLNAKALLALGDALSVDGASVINRYASLIGEVGTRSQSAQAASDMSLRLADDAARSRSELSDVNLDEEAAHLLQFQQAYAASAKVIAAANEMFRTLLGALG